jgi:hypothetical protein
MIERITPTDSDISTNGTLRANGRNLTLANGRALFMSS